MKLNFLSKIIFFINTNKMNKIIKISSNEGGSFTKSNNLCNFDIPADGVYNLANSYVNLVSNITSAGADDANGKAVSIPNIDMFMDDGATDEDVYLTNVSLVKNFSMSCANKGSIADIRRVDVLRSNLNNYKLSQDEQRSLNYQSVFQPFGISQQKNSIFREIRKEGSVLSRDVEGGIRIPLSQLCNFGKVQQYDAEKYGKTRLHLELNIEKVRISQYLGAGGGAQWDRGDARDECEDLANNVGGVTRGVATDKLFVKRPFKNLEDTNFWVGQKITVSASGAGGSVDLVNVPKQIISIEFVRGALAAATDTRIMLTLSSALLGGGLPNTQAYTDVKVTGEAAVFNGGNGFQVDFAEIVLEKVMAPTKSQPVITYSEFSTEEFNASGVARFQRQFQLEPTAFNVYIFRNSLAAVGGIWSRDSDVLDWRLRLNNEDLTNRNIVKQSPLAYDRLIMTLSNTGDTCHNLNQHGRKNSGNYLQLLEEQLQNANQTQLIIANPLYVTPNEKMLQVNINSNSASLNHLCIFKECVREL